MRTRTGTVIITGMFAAVLAVLSPIAIPMPFGVPLTLQTFAVALTGYVLGWKIGAAAVGIYILLGIFGMPVFAGFGAGPGVVAGMSGGFILGFLPMVMLCGVSVRQNAAWNRLFISAAGLLVCHLCGVFQFMNVAEMGFAEAAMFSSLPYLLKDAVMQFAAYAAASTIRRSLK